MSSLTISLSKVEDGVVIACVSESEDHTVTEDKRLDVHYGPDSLTVTAPESVGQEEELEAECHTSPSLPPASLYWTVEVGGVLLTPQAQTEVRLAPGGGFLSVSSLRLRPGRGQTVRVKCEA